MILSQVKKLQNLYQYTTEVLILSSTLFLISGNGNHIYLIYINSINILASAYNYHHHRQPIIAHC